MAQTESAQVATNRTRSIAVTQKHSVDLVVRTRPGQFRGWRKNRMYDSNHVPSGRWADEKTLYGKRSVWLDSVIRRGLLLTDDI